MAQKAREVFPHLFHESGHAQAVAAVTVAIAVVHPAGGDEQEVVGHLGDGGQDLPDVVPGVEDLADDKGRLGDHPLAGI